MSIKSFPDYKHLLHENYVEYKYIFLTLLKLFSKILCHVYIVTLQFQILQIVKARITDDFATITEDMLDKTWREIYYRLDVLHATKVAHVEVH